MKSQIRLLSGITALALCGSAAWAQSTSSTNTVSPTNTPQVFRVSFSATCQSFDSVRGRVVTSRLTERNIIAQAVGGSASNRALTRNFALVYNATDDSLQVVDANQQPIVDVIHFGGGSAITDGRQLDRFTFLFFPGQTNELGAETNVFGSAVITERANQSSHNGTTGVPRITGKLQFVLTGDNMLGMTNQFVLTGTTNSTDTNSVSTTNGLGTVTATSNQGSFSNILSSGGFVMVNSNIVFDASARICTGTFTTVRGTGSTASPRTPVTTNTNGVTTTNTNANTGGTNGTPGVTSTNGTTTGNPTGNNGVIGFNTTTGTTTTIPGTTTGTFGTGSVAGTTGTGTVGATTTPGVTTTTGTVNTGTGTVGVGTTGVTVGTGATPTGSGVITTGAGTTGTGTTTTGTTGTTTGTPIIVSP